MMKVITTKRFWVALAMIIGLLFLRLSPFIISAAIVLSALLFNPKTAYPLRNYKFWVVILFLVMLVPIFTGVHDRTFLGVSYSSLQFQTMLYMALRGISVFLLFQVLTIDLQIENIKSLLTKFGIKNFDIIYNLSNEIFPKIKSILIARYSQFRIRWKTKYSFEHLITLFSDIFIDFFRLTDQLSNDNPDIHTTTTFSLLEQIRSNQYPSVIIVVGDAGTGKTPWLEELIQLLKSKGETVDGLISRKMDDSEDSWHHNLVRISTNESHQLTSMDEIDTQISIGKFNFIEDSLIWGNEQLKSISDVNWIIVDEVGLLEFNGSGFVPGLQSVVGMLSGTLVITIRSSLVDRLNEFIKNYLPSVVSWKKQIINI